MGYISSCVGERFSVVPFFKKRFSKKRKIFVVPFSFSKKITREPLTNALVHGLSCSAVVLWAMSCIDHTEIRSGARLHELSGKVNAIPGINRCEGVLVPPYQQHWLRY
jgi:hypothetical protein